MSEITFENLIKDKNVIIIGPSGHLKDSNSKEFLDSFDTVIRNYPAWPMSDHLYKDYGSRCDILYFNSAIVKIHDYKLPITEYLNSGVKHLVFKSPKSFTGQALNKLNSQISTSVIRICTKYKNTQLNLGPIMIADVLTNKPKSIYITGMDCHMPLNKDSDVYIEDYTSQKEIDWFKNLAKNENNNIHDVELNKEYLVNLIHDNDTINASDILLNVLNIKNTKEK